MVHDFTGDSFRYRIYGGHQVSYSAGFIDRVVNTFCCLRGRSNTAGVWDVNYRVSRCQHTNCIADQCGAWVCARLQRAGQPISGVFIKRHPVIARQNFGSQIFNTWSFINRDSDLNDFIPHVSHSRFHHFHIGQFRCKGNQL